VEKELVEDHELWKKVRLGDAQAFDAFYREMAPRLFGFLRQLIGDRQAAEDVMQETFIQMWRSSSGFTPEKGSLRAYLFGMARKCAAGWWRKQGSEGRTPPFESFECATEITSLVSDAFQRLDEDRRSLLWLREVEGQSYAELAQILEIPVGTVRSRLFTAREELRSVWHAARPVKKEVL
jgi:RNA polymerase sigma-70 factor (ECF subfamily)